LKLTAHAHEEVKEKEFRVAFSGGANETESLRGNDPGPGHKFFEG